MTFAGEGDGVRSRHRPIRRVARSGRGRPAGRAGSRLPAQGSSRTQLIDHSGRKSSAASAATASASARTIDPPDASMKCATCRLTTVASLSPDGRKSSRSPMIGIPSAAANPISAAVPESTSAPSRSARTAELARMSSSLRRPATRFAWANAATRSAPAGSRPPRRTDHPGSSKDRAVTDPRIATPRAHRSRGTAGRSA